MSNPTTDLAARFEAKREECLRKSEKYARHSALCEALWRHRARAFAEARDMARADAAGGADGDFFSDFNEADYKPDLASAIAVEIMGLKWTHAVPDGVQFTDEAAQDEHCNRYGEVQELVLAALTKARTQPHVTPPPAQQGSSPPLRQGETVEELERLSKAATSGEWSAEEAGRITARGTSPGYDIPVWGTILTAHDTKDIEDGVTHWSTDGARQANARYVVALVNAFRSGQLVPASLATARDDGTGAGSGLDGLCIRNPAPDAAAPAVMNARTVTINRKEVMPDDPEQSGATRGSGPHVIRPREEVRASGGAWAPIPSVSEVEAEPYLIRKGGYYYRPNRCGYTATPHDAGRYTREEAEAEAAIEPWHMSAVKLSDALSTLQASQAQDGEVER